MRMMVGFLAVWSATCVAQDRVSLKNGNAFDAQVQSVGEANVVLKTAYGEMRVARREIDAIVFGGRMVRISFVSGDRIMAVIAEEGATSMMVSTGSGPRRIERQEIVGIDPIARMRFDALGRELPDLPTPVGGREPVLAYVAEDKDERPVGDLRADEIKLKIDGTEVPANALRPASPSQLLVLLDASSSMAARKKQVGEALDSFARAVAPATVQIMSFNDDIRLLDSAVMPSKALESLEFKGGSLLLDAIASAVRHAEAPGPRHAIVVVTDGTDTGSGIVPTLAMERLKASDIPCYAIGLLPEAKSGTPAIDVNSVDEGALERMANVSGGAYFEKNPRKKDKNPELTTIFVRIADALAARRAIALDPSRLGPGWHQVEIDTSRKGTKIRYKKEVYIPGAA